MVFENVLSKYYMWSRQYTVFVCSPTRFRAVIYLQRPRPSKQYVYGVIEKDSIDSRPFYRLGVFSTVHTKTFENERTICCDVS